MVDYETTLRFGPSDPSGNRPLLVSPALTVVWHPNLDRIGQMAMLWPEVGDDRGSHLSRDEPTFAVPGLDTGRPLDHRAISRKERPTLRFRYRDGGFEIERLDQQIEIAVNLKTLAGTLRLSAEEVRAGVVITVGRHFVFCFHLIRTPVTRSSVPGLLGTSDAIEDLRRSILRAAKREPFVLLRGESGTGKELAARALHEAGPRAKGPFIPVNMAALGGDQARADIFGYKKGAFTGATAGFPGHFRSAAGGTIFLDEIGFLTSDVQPMLFRVLDDQEILSMGTSQLVKVDVRIVAATDRNLEDLVEKGQFERSLYNRLESAVTIPLAPLRKRREDVGCLLVHFLLSKMGDAAELQRLLDKRPEDRPWLWASDVAAVALSPFPGNARDLKGLAANLLARASDAPYDSHGVVKDFLVRRDPRSSQKDASTAKSTSAPLAELSDDQILAVFDRFHGNREDVARYLGKTRVTLWRRIRKSPKLKQIIDERWPR